MDSNLVYAKTPIGDEAVRQSTRVVQRNLRMVLVQVDGKMTVEELSAKIGNPRLVHNALRELETGGFIAPTVDAVSVWEESMKAAKLEAASKQIPPMSQFSTFGPRSLGGAESIRGGSAGAAFSSFGKPIFPSSSRFGKETPLPPVTAQVSEPEDDHDRPGMTLGRKSAWAIACLLVLSILTVIFFPYDQFKPALEASATRALNTPVKIDRVGLALFPSPSLKLAGVRIGELANEKISELRISSPLSLLGGAPYHIANIDVSGAVLPANRLVALPMFNGARTGSPEVIVKKIVFKQLQLTLGDSLAFDNLFGEVAFRQDGSIEKSTFETVDRSMLINVEASGQGIALGIEGRAWKPAGSQVSFASLQAKGLLLKNRLLIQNIDTTFLGGILRGNWLIDWSNGLTMTGDGTLSRVDTRLLSAAFAPSLRMDGDMSGTLRLRSTGSDWESLWGNLEVVLNTEITRGAFHGVDLGEAVRRGGGTDVRAGSTKFDRLRSTVNVTPKQVVGRDVRMDAGMVTAVGQFSSARNGEVEGSMSVTMQTSVASQNTSVRIYGVLPDLSATTRK